MAKRKNPPAPKPASQDQPATLKDLLSPEILGKLKAQADELKAVENKKTELIRTQAEEARKAEQKRLENDFEHLLNNSNLDWRKNK
ncbi:YqkE family protein [Paenibacillus eucommiae]|uniref:DUF3886 domain-containing protein n=1 Tax=Paenibacillus eucommiae TaxID=1355755 RepID=A0ABS4IMH5_9BACL|nr:YqkE family protein [Paenibacillus eucommiae]MBP1988773.1 hypothetical protein [Paenibacillus eucommiae]